MTELAATISGSPSATQPSRLSVRLDAHDKALAMVLNHGDIS
ncbi:MAG TPA: hypothetical protein VFW14_19765 [Gaiellales bacterium]|jgi:hypothetical protein|nr:hypothetical protein [Gaiellales bacterium]